MVVVQPAVWMIILPIGHLIVKCLFTFLFWLDDWYKMQELKGLDCQQNPGSCSGTMSEIGLRRCFTRRGPLAASFHLSHVGHPSRTDKDNLR